MPQDIVQIKLHIQVPDEKWLAKFNKKYPELIFQIMSKFLLDTRTGMTLFQVKGITVKQFLNEFRELSEEITFQILFEGEDFAILNVKTEDPWILSALIKTELLISYPVTIKNSAIMLDILSERHKIDEFLIELESKKISYSLKSIGYYNNSALLTDKQNEILTLGLKYGYFDIPRKLSLSNFAEKVGVSPSALSEMLRRINKKLATYYLM
ncbi:MAG: hypothetical protein EU535_08805 [Promethearchaeota archaeon]|nr:MAG: hypothetical protein EU535_08805 [Candidatus Lokiarchaeota archaeon]